MLDTRLGAVETRFADIVWENAPVSTKRLVEICKEVLEWKRTTTYTVLKKLCQRGLFKTECGVVSALVTKEEYSAIRSEQFVDEAFGGSLPSFIAAFSKRKRLTEGELEQIKKMIARMEGD